MRVAPNYSTTASNSVRLPVVLAWLRDAYYTHIEFSFPRPERSGYKTEGVADAAAARYPRARATCAAQAV